MRVIQVTFISLARWLSLGGPRGGGADSFLYLFTAEASGATLAVHKQVRVLLIEQILPAGGTANGINITSVNFKACFAGFFAGFFAGTVILGNASR